ncbi:MAG TPA: ABC transporter ATP-binding protein, partial [Bacilli bacterium]|nr:ABC transporter ATP-binding protein [Bacilli bacterium]
MLELKNITKNYYVGPMVVEALKGISIEFRKNEFVAILGPSGCGKTTLLNIIGGLDRYTSGDLLVNHRSTTDFKDHDWDSYRNHSIGFVFQNYNLISHISVLRNVELALTLSGVSVSERRERALKALADVGLADQIHKRPNQLSGGQMQRVAIARALVNNPDVLLADEPTGALDTETSRQIMEILKAISHERLIIMVTHNSSIAQQYATRIVKLLDGLIVDDNHPYHQAEQVVAKKIGKEKTSMSFLTALSLSLGNLITKKARTILTAFAGSIGIIGIALVLSLSNGFQRYIDKMQADTLASYPLTISETTLDFGQIMSLNRGTDLEEFPTDAIIHVNAIRQNIQNALITNDINDQYIHDVIEHIDPSLYNGITYSYGVQMRIFREMPFGAETYHLEVSTGNHQLPFMRWNELIESDNVNNPFSFLETQYDVLSGHLPKSKNEIVLVVDSYNQITDLSLLNLGFANVSETAKYSFNDFLGYKMKLVLNNGLYTFDGTKFTPNYQQVSGLTMLNPGIYDSEQTLDLEIVGIIRVNEDTPTGAVNGVFGYTKALTDFVLENSLASEIVMWMEEAGHENLNPLTGNAYLAGESTVAEQRQATLRELGGMATPSEIAIFPVDFNAKKAIKLYLDEENTKLSDAAIRDYYQ